ncbi:MAG: bifunctional phosphoribosylaminoimidazolecarboxamide formyltransferase/IMP cyclohydrolase [Bdellovibrionales bacterium]|nr:bifunctional phosphoribosylaminoimidazolecarboxamide formyltransferase/IMP cyclohydrolase [Bdellovibrionales bacterium]
MSKFKNALISVSDKTGLVDFIKPLYEQGMRLVSTGGTARTLREAGMRVIDVSEQTGFPEVMDGRVKTLHPNIHMPLLARDSHPEDMRLLQENDLEPFDLIIVNLYPFEQTLATRASQADLIENIDIGGPSLLRGASKNFERITVVVDPEDYAYLAQTDYISLDDRQRLAAKAFAHVSSYDAMISQALAPQQLFPNFSLGGTRIQALRYGENPHQKASWYKRRGAQAGWHEAKILQGKELSYNNLLDLESALQLVRDLDGPSAVAVKHNNPCGAATAETLDAAVEKCLTSDPVSVFGGIVAVNQPVTVGAAEALAKIFLECVVAPSYSPEALQIFAKKKNVRLLEWKGMGIRDDFWRIQTIQGGFLIQEPDHVHLWNPEWKIHGAAPSPQVRSDLSFAWAAVAALKSNAIAIAENKQTLGLGMGQTNRVDSVELAIGRMRKFHPQASTPVLASDAFFPFPDSIELIHQAGIRWVIQPGGSMRDEEVLGRAKDLGVNLILTGQRHFRH